MPSIKINTENLVKDNSDTIDSICNEIKAIDELQKFFALSGFAYVLSYFSTTINKRRLICKLNPNAFHNCNFLPDNFPIDFISIIIVLICSIYFYILSEKAFFEPFDSCIDMRSAKYTNISAFMSLLTAIVDLINIILVHSYDQKTPTMDYPILYPITI